MASFEHNKKSKLWSVRFRELEDGREVNKRLSGYKTKKQAQEAYENYIYSNKTESEKEQAIQSELQSNPNNMLFDTLVENYLAYNRTRVKESSFYDTKSKITNHILPYFCGKHICDISPIDIVNWQLALDKYSYAYKSGLRGHLNAIYKYGERYYDIKNTATKVEPMRNLETAKEMQCWDKQTFLKFISCVENVSYKALFWTLYITGCRKGEALALSWEDVNFKDKTITINKNVTRKTLDKSTYAVTTPKNKSSNRTVDIPDNLCIILAEYRKWQKDKVANTKYVFGGEHPLPDRSINRYFLNAIKQAGVPKIRLHDLRHSCASLLISEGVSIVAVSKRLGHKNIEQTLNTYSHIMPSDITLMMEILNNI